MNNENRFLKAVTKLNELTQERQLTWTKTPNTAKITQGTEDIVDIAYCTEKDGKRLRIFGLRFRDTPDAPWESQAILEIVDAQGNCEWKFPSTAATWHLLESVRYQASGADSFISDLVEDPSKVPITDGNLTEAFLRIQKLRADEIAAKAMECRKWLHIAGVTTKAQLMRLVESKEILSWLEEIYVRELKRDKEAPLDPVAVAVWGGALLTHGFTESVKNQIIEEIRKSSEYLEKHREPPKT